MNAERIIEALEIVAAWQLNAAGKGDWQAVIVADGARAQLLAELAGQPPEAVGDVGKRLADVAAAGAEVMAALERHLVELRGELRAASEYRHRRDLYAKAAC
jgi:hypothetical protein